MLNPDGLLSDVGDTTKIPYMADFFSYQQIITTKVSEGDTTGIIAWWNEKMKFGVAEANALEPASDDLELDAQLELEFLSLGRATVADGLDQLDEGLGNEPTVEVAEPVEAHTDITATRYAFFMHILIQFRV